MCDTKKLAHALCKQFRRHDDDASENLIASMLERFAGSIRFDEQNSAVERFRCVRGVMGYAEQRMYEDAIKASPGWLKP